MFTVRRRSLLLNYISLSSFVTIVIQKRNTNSITTFAEKLILFTVVRQSINIKFVNKKQSHYNLRWYSTS